MQHSPHSATVTKHEPFFWLMKWAAGHYCIHQFLDIKYYARKDNRPIQASSTYHDFFRRLFFDLALNDSVVVTPDKRSFHVTKLNCSWSPLVFRRDYNAVDVILVLQITCNQQRYICAKMSSLRIFHAALSDITNLFAAVFSLVNHWYFVVVGSLHWFCQKSSSENGLCIDTVLFVYCSRLTFWSWLSSLNCDSSTSCVKVSAMEWFVRGKRFTLSHAILITGIVTDVTSLQLVGELCHLAETSQSQAYSNSFNGLKRVLPAMGQRRGTIDDPCWRGVWHICNIENQTSLGV